MREDLLGLPLERAQEILAEQGLSPRVRETCAPRRAPGGCLRVVSVSKDGMELTAARFFDPILALRQEKR
ncbi:MAG: hypothetical protein Q4G52_10145 [Clostridia bacterium]|nr:hypothetical protein [Clostridia bacterium]